jgi:hypothetical protein
MAFNESRDFRKVIEIFALLSGNMGDMPSPDRLRIAGAGFLQPDSNHIGMDEGFNLVSGAVWIQGGTSQFKQIPGSLWNAGDCALYPEASPKRLWA